MIDKRKMIDKRNRFDFYRNIVLREHLLTFLIAETIDFLPSSFFLLPSSIQLWTSSTVEKIGWVLSINPTDRGKEVDFLGQLNKISQILSHKNNGINHMNNTIICFNICCKNCSIFYLKSFGAINRNRRTF